MPQTSEYEHHLRSLARRLELEISGYGIALNSAYSFIKERYGITGTQKEVLATFKERIPQLVLSKEKENAL